MRKIKFRIWDVRSKQFYPDGFSVAMDGTEWYDDSQFSHSLTNGDWLIMQFTGLTDKNGVEIYEGDIVQNIVTRKEFKHEGTVSGKMGYVEVSYCSQSVVTYDTHWAQFNITAPTVHERGALTVIGNIHSTPELLTPKQ